MNFDHLGVMLDCSRNAVLKVSSVKRYIDILHSFGFNTLMLYTEDTYEVNNQSYFGYFRGRYSKAELMEMDSYARSKEIELIPCIQTLAHLNSIFRWHEYRDYRDINDILLANDERTYKLIDDMFETLEECFSSRSVNIGMDEAHLVGLGKYLDEHGFSDRSEILLRHLEKVCEIAYRHGFKPMMWSDMFFRLATGGDYYNTSAAFDKKIVDMVPKDLSLIYWDYYSKDKEHYDNMLTAHRQFNNEIWVASGVWTWNGFAPRNRFSMETVTAAVDSCLDKGVKNIIFTAWGDDGAECSLFTVLPALFYAGMRSKAVKDMDIIKSEFKRIVGIEFDDFLLLDLPDTTSNANNTYCDPEKYMFYNDPFCGIFDYYLTDDTLVRYDKCAEKLAELTSNAEYGYLFRTMQTLCQFLQIKYTLGYRTRKIYKASKKNIGKTFNEQTDPDTFVAFQGLLQDYETAITRLDEFFTAHRERWFTDNKPFGFEVQEIRIGGLLLRLKSLKNRIEDYSSGKIDCIEELEEELLPAYDNEFLYFNNWAATASVNVISHEL